MKRVRSTENARYARRGITIIETMVVVTGAALLLGMCAVSIQLLMKLNADSHNRVAESMAFERLGRQLRSDVHASHMASTAVEAKMGEQAAGLRLTFEPDHTVLYEFGDGGVVRTESRGGKAVRHERYSLARGTGAHFELRDKLSRRMVALVVTRLPGKSQTEPQRPLELLALQGKDQTRPTEQERSKP